MVAGIVLFAFGLKTALPDVTLRFRPFPHLASSVGSRCSCSRTSRSVYGSVPGSAGDDGRVDPLACAASVAGEVSARPSPWLARSASCSSSTSS
jgi:hypothetical protein